MRTLATVDHPGVANFLEDERQRALAVAAESAQHEERLGDLEGVLHALSRCVCLLCWTGFEGFAAHTRSRSFKRRAEVDCAPVIGGELLGQLRHSPALEAWGQGGLAGRELQPGRASVQLGPVIASSIGEDLQLRIECRRIHASCRALGQHGHERGPLSRHWHVVR